VTTTDRWDKLETKLPCRSSSITVHTELDSELVNTLRAKADDWSVAD